MPWTPGSALHDADDDDDDGYEAWADAACAQLAEYTRHARELLGAGPLLAPEQKVVLETDPERARAIGRPRVERPYLGLSNYLANLRRLGWTDADFADGGSDRLIDALVLHGDAEAIGRGITAHLDAGADHVAIQVLGPDPLAALWALAPDG